jgi:hypothetical protein
MLAPSRSTVILTISGVPTVRRLDEYAALIHGPILEPYDSSDRMTMSRLLKRRAATIHCEHQLVLGAVLDGS